MNILMISPRQVAVWGTGTERNDDRVRTAASGRRSPDGDTSAPTPNVPQLERPGTVPGSKPGIYRPRAFSQQP